MGEWLMAKRHRDPSILQRAGKDGEMGTHIHDLPAMGKLEKHVHVPQCPHALPTPSPLRTSWVRGTAWVTLMMQPGIRDNWILGVLKGSRRGCVFIPNSLGTQQKSPVGRRGKCLSPTGDAKANSSLWAWNPLAGQPMPPHPTPKAGPQVLQVWAHSKVAMLQATGLEERREEEKNLILQNVQIICGEGWGGPAEPQLPLLRWSVVRSISQLETLRATACVRLGGDPQARGPGLGPSKGCPLPYANCFSHLKPTFLLDARGRSRGVRGQLRWGRQIIPLTPPPPGPLRQVFKGISGALSCGFQFARNQPWAQVA